MNMKSLIIHLSVIAFIGCVAADDCHLEKFEACGEPVSEFRKKMGKSFPTDNDQVNEFCDNLKTSIDCAEAYQKKCMTPLQIESMGFLSDGPMATYNEFCTDGSKIRQDYLDNAKCLDETSKTQEARDQYSYLEAALEDLSEIKPERRLATVCCGYQWIQKRSEEMGTERCGADAVKSFRQVTEMAVSVLPQVMCSGFDPDSSQCAEYLPPPGAKPTGNIRKNHIAEAFASIYIPDIKEDA